MTEFDSPWKEAIVCFFQRFLAFFFLHVHDDIDWSRGYETLDKEFQQIVRQGELGRSIADLLFKVWLKTGEEKWILMHVEVQAQRQIGFEKRMYRYNSRAEDRYNVMAVSIAVLADDEADWLPNRHTSQIWKVGVDFPFLTAKLLRWRGREAELENNPNPFAAIVLAHLKSRETQGDLQARRAWKFRLVRSLLERNLTAEEIRELFRFIDWVLDLPDAVNDEFLEDVYQLEQEKNVTYITYPERRGERRGEQRGLTEGIETALEIRFGDDGIAMMPEIRQIDEGAKLRQILDSTKTVTSIDELRDLVAQLNASDPSSPNK